MKIAFDMSSYIKTAMLTGKDSKDGIHVIFEDKPVVVNSAEYGYEIVINMMTKTLREHNLRPIDCILVFEGTSSKSRRLMIDGNYKAKRDKHPPEFYEEFVRLRDYVEQVWKELGAIVMVQDFVEGDDVLAWLAENMEEDLIIASRDSDLGKLNTEQGQTNKYGATVTTNNDGLIGIAKIDGEPFVHPFKYITLYKALVGDSSDNIPGAKGFGPAKFQQLAEKYGYDGLDELIGCIEKGKLDDLHEVADELDAKGKKPAHPLVKLIVDHEKDVIRSWKLAKLYPEWITMHKPVKGVIQFRPGKSAPKPDDADHRLAHWYGLQYLVTADNYEEALEFFKEQAAVSPDLPFDIETSTPPESDDWLAAQGNPDGVDQLASKLTGFSFTVGDNQQHTFYVSVDHADTDNITMSQARRFIEAAIDTGKELVIQNTFFELSVLAMAEDEDGSKWTDHWQKYGERGFLPNVLDTKIEGSYVNENIKLGLKFRSKYHLGYEQASYDETTLLTGKPGTLPQGGRLIREWEEPDPLSPSGLTVLQQRRYKMNELSAEQVIEYGADDTICTAALHRYYKLAMQLEHQYDVYLDIEIDPCYQHAKNFIDGIAFSLQTMNKLEKIDDETYDEAWGTVRSYLMKHGWKGTVPPTYGADISAAEIKEAYRIVQGYRDTEKDDLNLMEPDEDMDISEERASLEEAGVSEEDVPDEFLKTKVRTPAKLVVHARALGHETFATMLEECLAGEHEKFTAWVREHFSGEPIFAISNKQMCNLLYEVMKLPVRVRNKPTEIMRSKGLQGNPKGDALAIAYALRDASEEQKEVLESLKLMQMVKTRRGLYYSKYPHFIHWMTGRIHPSHNQCETNTRRASTAKPNSTQWPKLAKITGQPARFRETIVPHHPKAVVVSLDFDSQELRVIADYSRDENMVACYVGDHKKDMHALTGHSIAVKKKMVEVTITYEEFAKAAKDKSHSLYKVCSEYRALGKKVNFTTEFGAMAPKLAMTMLVPEDEAQTYIDAKEAMFPGVRLWKNATIEESKREGIVRTKSGAVRHLGAIYASDDHWLKSKAERQSVNFKVQGSSAEMTKKAEGRMWRAGLVFDFDAVCYGPVHDEVVFSVMIEDLVPFLEKAHWCMTQPYGNMHIPIESSISFGPSFGQQAEIGLRPTADAVAEGWKEIEKILAESKEKVAA